MWRTIRRSASSLTARPSTASASTCAAGSTPGARASRFDLNARLVRIGDELEVDVTTTIDHRKLGMTHSTLGMIRTPTELTVRGRLVTGSD